MQLPNLVQLLLDVESGNEGRTHPKFFLCMLLQVVVLCSTAFLGLNANPACDWS